MTDEQQDTISLKQSKMCAQFAKLNPYKVDNRPENEFPLYGDLVRNEWHDGCIEWRYQNSNLLAFALFPKEQFPFQIIAANLKQKQQRQPGYLNGFLTSTTWLQCFQT